MTPLLSMMPGMRDRPNLILIEPEMPMERATERMTERRTVRQRGGQGEKGSMSPETTKRES
jgi:hypothetical protein